MEKDAINDKCLGRYGGYLDKWAQVHIEMFGENAPRPNIHDKKDFALHRVAGGSVMQDACNQAQKLGTLLQEDIATQVKASLGDDWAKLSPEEKKHETRCLRLFCQNHLRNTCLRWALKAEQKFLKDILEEIVKSIDSKFRVGWNMDLAVRAACREFLYSRSHIYAKGHGQSFLAWALENHPKEVIFILERADLGTRQDASTEGALSLYMMIVVQ
mmetsp:Transcript_30874/g.39761  ORF Transcript_30874/g.39761 Transcript_30874/m.39761 type:complete len:215 (+) Transcript_30874:1890-2534(+)